MKKLFALGLLAAFGAWVWSRRQGGVTFTVLLKNLPPSIGLTVWDAFWWDGSRLVPNKLGLARPVAEAALFQDVSFVQGSFILATVTLDGIPVQQAAMLPDPVGGARYGYDWFAMTLTRIA